MSVGTLTLKLPSWSCSKHFYWDAIFLEDGTWTGFELTEVNSLNSTQGHSFVLRVETSGPDVLPFLSGGLWKHAFVPDMEMELLSRKVSSICSKIYRLA